jgi:leader peptidase (prepilin peptidase)/N-methyltransferase
LTLQADQPGCPASTRAKPHPSGRTRQRVARLRGARSGACQAAAHALPSRDVNVAVIVAAAGAVPLGALAGRALDHLAPRVPRRSPVPSAGPAAPAPVPSRALGAPLPEVAGGLVAGLLVLRFGLAPQLPAWLWWALVALLLAVVDLRERVLPNRVLLPGTAVAALLLTAAAAADGTWAALVRALAAAAVSFAVLLAMAVAAPAGLGMGDAKLAGFLGLYLGWLGWPPVLSGLLLGFVLQALIGLALLAARRAGRRTELPFGPALLAGALVAALLAGPWAVHSG